MAKIDRYNGNVQAFGSESLSTERTVFGDETQSDTLDANITADFLRGWGIVGVNENPTKQDFNGLGFTLSQLISYLHQSGIPEWNTAQEVFEGGVVTTLAGVYRLKAGGDASADPDTDGGVNWEKAPTRAEIDKRVIYVGSVAELEGLSSPIDGNHALVSGVPFEYNSSNWLPSANFVTPEIYGAIGNGIVDDTTAWISALSAGVNIVAGFGLTYLITDELSVSQGQNINLNLCTLDFQIVGQKTPMTFASNTSINNGRMEQNGNSGGMSISGFQMLIYGVDTKNFICKNIKMAGTLGNQAAIGFYGDINNHKIDGITFDSSVPFGQGVIYHWLCADGGLNASALNMTNHPRNIKISNIEGGTFTNAGSLTSAVFLSGCYNVDLNNVHLDNSERLVTVYPGDYADEFSFTRDKAFVNSGIIINNPSIRVSNGAAIHTTGRGILSSETVPTNVEINAPMLRGNNANSFGVFSSFSSGVKVNGGKIWANQFNIALGESVKGFKVDGSEITEGLNRGVSCGAGNTIPNENINVLNCYLHNNNTVSDVINSSSGIYLDETLSANISGNMFGLRGGPEKQRFSVYIDTSCNEIKLSDNHTFSSGSTTAYTGNNATPYSMSLWDGGNNTSDTTNNFAGHVWYNSKAFNKRVFEFDGGSGSPATGSWVAGDTLYYRTPIFGFIGSVCTASGTPGTWKTFGVISA